MKKHNFVEDNIVILSKQTLDLLLAQPNPADLIALYTFYYYTAKWQGTNQPKATTAYAAKGLRWGERKVMKSKRKLIESGLIEDVRQIDKDTKKVKGWYIKINYLWKRENHPVGLLQSGSGHTVDRNTTNALSANNKNALTPLESEAQQYNQKLFSSYKAITGESPKDDPEARQKYPRLIRKRWPDIDFVIAAIRWGWNLQNKRGDYYWRGRMSLAKLYHRIFPDYESELKAKRNREILAEKKRSILKSMN